MRLVKSMVIALAGLISSWLLLVDAHDATGVDVFETVLQAEAMRGWPVGIEIHDGVDPAAGEPGFVRVPASKKQSGNGEAFAAGLRFDLPPAIEFAVPNDGDLTLWVRARWRNVCANSLNVTIDGQSLMQLGNDEVFDEWHWISHPLPLRLAAGLHELQVVHAELGIDVDCFVIRRGSTPPAGADSLVCFGHDLASVGLDVWQSRTPDCWSVVGDPAGVGATLRLVGPDTEAIEYIVRNDVEFIPGLQLSATVVPRVSESRVQLLWGYRAGAFDFVALGHDVCTLGRVRQSSVTEQDVGPGLGELGLELRRGRPVHLALRLDAGTIACWVDGERVFEAACDEVRRGFVGVGASADIDFTRITASQLEEPRFSTGFYLDARPLDDLIGCEVVHGVWRRTHHLQQPLTYALEGGRAGKQALLVSGEHWWSDITFSSAVLLLDGATVDAGLVFAYLDDDNHCRVALASERLRPDRGVIRLIRRHRGADAVLASAQVEVHRDAWSVLSVRVADSEVTVEFDGASVLRAVARVGPGCVGLFADGAAGEVPRSRPPVLLPEYSCVRGTSLTVPLRFGPEEATVSMLFDYDGSSWWSHFVQAGDSGAVVGVARFANGAWQEPVRQVDVPFSPGLDDHQRLAYYLQLRVVDDGVQLFLNGQPFQLVREQPGAFHRIAMHEAGPQPLALFDDLVVRSSTAAPEAVLKFHRFDPGSNAARELAAWEFVVGEWGSSHSMDALGRSLVARFGAEGRIELRSRAPLVAAGEDCVAVFRPSVGVGSVAVVLTADPGDVRDGLQCQVDFGKNVISTSRGGEVLARSVVPSTRMGQSAVGDLVLAIRPSGDRVEVLWQEQVVHSVSKSGDDRDQHVIVTATGRAGAYCAIPVVQHARLPP